MNLLSSANNPEDLWNLETIGIVEPLDTINDDRAMGQFDRSVYCENGRYYITWPWKCEYPDLPEKFDVAMSRMKSSANVLKRI